MSYQNNLWLPTSVSRTHYTRLCAGLQKGKSPTWTVGLCHLRSRVDSIFSTARVMPICRALQSLPSPSVTSITGHVRRTYRSAEIAALSVSTSSRWRLANRSACSAASIRSIRSVMTRLRFFQSQISPMPASSCGASRSCQCADRLARLRRRPYALRPSR